MNVYEMQGPKDLHMHTLYCDGKNSAEEMVLAGIEKKLETIGISGHVFTEFDQRYCMSEADMDKYYDEIRGLAIKYADKIRVLCGIEQDYYSECQVGRWDYVIGSVHYIRVPAKGSDAPRTDFLGADPGYYEVGRYAYIPVDDSDELLIAAAQRYFDGDIYSLIEEYFVTVADVVNRTKPDIIGHFDLICKFNKNGKIFDENHPRYVAAWKSAADELIKTGVPFEINTGAISRGYTDYPYPSKPIREYIKSNGGKFIWSSDSHSKDTICAYFGEF